MKERPILFSGPMVRAILEGRKTQTRRVVKRTKAPECDTLMVRPEAFGTGTEFFMDAANPVRGGTLQCNCPYGVPGDRLWVRENAIPDPPLNGWDGDVEWDGCGRPWGGVPVQYRSHAHVLYQASWTGSDIRWRPSIHMPRWASRLTLEVVGVRVERLQEISEADAIAEGVPKVNELWMEGDRPRAIAVYESVWDKINGVGSWSLNPWVWVVEFKTVEQMEGLTK